MDKPACWSWEVPEILPLFASEDVARQYLSDWHNFTCAICGCLYPDVEDHDHASGNVRGELCRRCNTQEAFSVRPLFLNYRERNPASILGLRFLYWSSWTGYAKPEAALTPQEERELRDLVDGLPVAPADREVVRSATRERPGWRERELADPRLDGLREWVRVNQSPPSGRKDLDGRRELLRDAFNSGVRNLYTLARAADVRPPTLLRDFRIACIPLDGAEWEDVERP